MKQGVLLTPAATATQLISGAQKPAVLLCQLLRLGHHAGSFSRLGSDDHLRARLIFNYGPQPNFRALAPMKRISLRRSMEKGSAMVMTHLWNFRPKSPLLG